MPRRRVIRPRPVEDWPTLFWTRAESSYAGNDLECRGGCNGTGIVSRRRVCPRCRGSGLLVPRRTPVRSRTLATGSPAWIGVPNNQLLWPLPWLWKASLLFVAEARGVYHSDEAVLAFMSYGQLCLALFRLDGDEERRLEERYRMAAGDGTGVPRFVVPKG